MLQRTGFKSSPARKRRDRQILGDLVFECVQSFVDAGGHGKLVVNDALYPVAYGRPTPQLL